MEILTFATVVKERRSPSIKRSIRNLATISEETDQTFWGRKFENPEDYHRETFIAREKHKNCHCNRQNSKDIVRQATTKAKDFSFSHICILNDSHVLSKRPLKTSKQQYLDEARAIFPDFFPRSTIQENSEDFSWLAKPTMEQIFSGQNNAFLEKFEQHENFEYWKKYKLSF